MSRRRRPRRSIESEIPTSSTGDIAFLLIIFFMVTASFAVTKGLAFDLPAGEIPATTEGRYWGKTSGGVSIQPSPSRAVMKATSAAASSSVMSRGCILGLSCGLAVPPTR